MRGHIRKRGSTYSIVVDVGLDENGKRKQKWISGFKTKKEAEAALAELINEVESGTFIMSNNVKVDKFLKYWLDNYAKPNLSPTTVYGYEIIIEKHLTPFFKDIELQKLRPIDLQQYFINKKDELSGKTLLQHYRVLHKALNFAFKNKLIKDNPIEYVDPPKPNKYHAKVLSLEEIKRLLECLKGSDLEVIINVALALGLRRGELLGLKWSDINFDEETVTIRNNLVRAGSELIIKTPKSDSSNRTLKISKNIIDMLKKHKVKQNEIKLQLGENYKNNDLVFCNKDGSMINPSTFSHIFSDFLKKNNLPQIRLHDLRHTNATLMLKSNISPKVAGNRLGHSTVTITLDLYSHVLTDMDKEAAQKIDNIIYGRQKE